MPGPSSLPPIPKGGAGLPWPPRPAPGRCSPASQEFGASGPGGGALWSGLGEASWAGPSGAARPSELVCLSRPRSPLPSLDPEITW